jgi:hypothetical protein
MPSATPLDDRVAMAQSAVKWGAVSLVMEYVADYADLLGPAWNDSNGCPTAANANLSNYQFCRVPNRRENEGVQVPFLFRR